MKTDQLALFADPNSDAGVLFRAIQHWSPVGLICWEMMERTLDCAAHLCRPDPA